MQLNDPGYAGDITLLNIKVFSPFQLIHFQMYEPQTLEKVKKADAQDT